MKLASKRVLVIGGGVTGQRAALDLVAAGLEVVLVERAVTLGGTVAQLGPMFPLHNCLLCRGAAQHGPGCTRPTIASELLDFSRSPHLSVRTQTELVELKGEPGAFRATLRTQPRYVDVGLCINCDRCAQACPQSLPDEQQAGLTQRKAAYRPSFRAVPNAYAITKGGYCRNCSRCAQACPTRAIDLQQTSISETLDVAAVVMATGMQLYDAALSGEYGYGRYPNVFTGLEMERMTSLAGPGEGRIARRSDGQVPQRIAWLQCVGSRDEEHDYCSSFCCGYATRQAVLARQLFSQSEAAIYLMDDRVFAHSFSATYDPLRTQYGIAYSRNRPSVIREDPQTRDLLLQITDESGMVREERYNMVVLSIGAEAARGATQLASLLGVQADGHGFVRTPSLDPVDSGRPGIYVAGVATAPADIADSVAQGSAAAARVRAFLSYPAPSLMNTPANLALQGGARRIGILVCDCAGEIGGVVDLPATMDYARSLPEVALAETIPYGCLPDGLRRMQAMVAAYRLTDVVVGACARRTYGSLFERSLPVPVRFVSLREECAYVHSDDVVGATRLAKELLRVGVDRARTAAAIEPPTVQPVRSALVLGGGLAGMTAALHLADGGIPVQLVERTSTLGGNALRLGAGPDGADIGAHAHALVKRVHSHMQITAYTDTELLAVSGRQGNWMAVLRKGDGTPFHVAAGATVVATGGQEYRGPAYGLGTDDRIVTLLDLGQRLADQPDLPQRLKQVVFVSCVGPWDEPGGGASWRCSRTCCEGIIKHAAAIKEANPACQVIVLSREVNAYGLREERYTAARKAGVLFVRFDATHKPLVGQSTEGLHLMVEEQSLHETLELHPDLLVLGVAILPREDAAQVSRRLGIQHIGEAFFREWESKTRSWASLEPGVYLCGLDQGPRPSGETITQALAAAEQALSYLSSDKITLSGAVAVVDKRRCMACLTCVRGCPYEVPVMVAAEPTQGNLKAVSYIDPARCQGCGICAADCPGKAIQINHYHDDQVIGDRLLGQWLVA
jgi:heterodisulfide reductase subunit A